MRKLNQKKQIKNRREKEKMHQIIKEKRIQEAVHTGGKNPTEHLLMHPRGKKGIKEKD